MSEHYVVTFADVMIAHEVALIYGDGVPGVSNEAFIHSAIGRPYHELHGLIPYPTPVAKAGCLLHGLMTCHGFNDGNKRTAWLVCSGFLSMEGINLLPPDGWYAQLAVMVKDHWTVEQVIKWVGKHAEVQE